MTPRAEIPLPVPPFPRSPVGDERPSPPGVPVGRRPIHRHPFDVYSDQVTRLKRLAMQETLAGGLGSMSRMVREAIDKYLADHESHDDTG